MKKWGDLRVSNVVGILMGVCTGLTVGCTKVTPSDVSDAGARTDAARGEVDAAGPREDAFVPDEPGVVVTQSGPVRGVPSGETWAYLGIPYAEPPLGALRWRPPQPHAPWTEIRDASTFASRCLQLDRAGGAPLGSEDCLALNVWTPSAPHDGPLPVLFYIHGGSNVSGSANEDSSGVNVHDGAYLSTHGPAVVVTIQYRLGVMGYLTHAALADESGEDSSGNYGLRDAIAALQWVRDNIARFGGDPSRVLVFGISAGAFDTCLLVTSPLARGLFSRAAVHSGGCGATNRARAQNIGRTIAMRLDCEESADVPACLRGKTAEQLVQATTFAEVHSGSFYSPVVDGVVIPEDPLTAIAAGRHTAMPIVFGTTRDEMSIFISAFQAAPFTTEAQYFAGVRGLMPTVSERVLAQYPIADYDGSPQRTFQALMSDLVFVCPTRRALRAFARGQREPVRRFVFAHRFDLPPLRQFGAAHGFDAFFFFHVLEGGSIRSTIQERALGDEMGAAWVRLAATGDPNGGMLPAWPPYDVARDDFEVFDTPMSRGEGERTEGCDFWDELAGG